MKCTIKTVCHWVTLAAVLAVLTGCTTHPTATITNESSVVMNGYVQIPSITTAIRVGYFPGPQKSSREVLHLEAGEKHRYTFRRDEVAAVKHYSSAVEVALLRSDGKWYLATVNARKRHLLHLSVRLDADGFPQITAASKAPVDERVLTKKEAMEALGEWVVKK